MIRPLLRIAGLLCALIVTLVLTHAVVAQDDEAPTFPTGTGTASVEARGEVTLPYTITPQGPLFALRPLARLLGAEVRVGPLGKSHSVLMTGGKQVTVGPESPVAVVLEGDGSDDFLSLSRTPVLGLEGVHVPIDFFARTFGDDLGYVFAWDGATGRLTATRDVARLVDARIALDHRQTGIELTTVRLLFSALPRYRIEQEPGRLEINLIGDSLAQPVAGTDRTSPLVDGIATTSSSLVLTLAPGARVPDGSVREINNGLTIDIIRRPGDPVDAPDPEAIVDQPPPAMRTSDPPGIRRIILDPGHGGSAAGAVGTRGTLEKELVLDISRRLASALERQLPVRVFLTRSRDVDLPHDARPAFANENKGDLFISVHLNASFSRSAHGAETYFLAQKASDEAAAASAAFENQGSGPHNDLEMILWDLAHTYHMAESQRLAKLVQEELNQALGLVDRGVKQAPFRVLRGVDMPAILVELGFISNPDEEEKLLDPAYQNGLIDALVRAISRFKTQMETRENLDNREAPETSGPPEGRR
ncbi:MAG: N-acetylmuramoyl-L-alanine amidase [Acidobacteriota bacterium]